MFKYAQSQPGRPASGVRAFTHGSLGITLIELLVVVAIIGLLLALTLVSVNRAREASLAVLCMSNYKTVGQEFFLFAEGHGRGPAAAGTGNNKLFSIEDFQEKLYRIDDYWDAGSLTEKEVDKSKTPLACPSAPGKLQKQKGLPCSSLAVGPSENISSAFNMRLYEVSTTVMGWPRLQRTRLGLRILEHPSVPLVFCADGRLASTNGVLPYYSAPPTGTPDLYNTGQFWFPSLRHGNKMNIGYIGGHVLRKPKPGNPGVEWNYQPPLQ